MKATTSKRRRKRERGGCGKKKEREGGGESKKQQKRLRFREKGRYLFIINSPAIGWIHTIPFNFFLSIRPLGLIITTFTIMICFILALLQAPFHSLIFSTLTLLSSSLHWLCISQTTCFINITTQQPLPIKDRNQTHLNIWPVLPSLQPGLCNLHGCLLRLDGHL